MSNDLLSAVFDDLFLPKESYGFSWTGRSKKSDGFEIELEVPGCTEEEVSVTVGGGMLYVTAKVRGHDLSKTYPIPAGCDLDKVTAGVENGLLTVKILPSERKKIL